ncbi:30S ribosomal protein S8 [Ktedonobacteria bacterium brp13]|jgi:small subunit ribosomal protein S8|nr:30S ribosomal protein S8 [Ktedonobacteria bacterium brp13]
MNMTDPIADMLTRIRNAATARHTRVLIPASKMKLSLARVLKEEGYVKDIEILKDNPQGTLRLTLSYADKKPVVTQLKRVSKPGLRVYTKKTNIPRVRGGLGVTILSTPQGIMTGSKAYHQGLGGEVICYVW